MNERELLDELSARLAREKALKDAVMDLKKLRSFHNGAYGKSINIVLNELEERYNKGYRDGQAAYAAHMALCEEEEKQTNWIPLSEKLPEDGEWGDIYKRKTHEH